MATVFVNYAVTVGGRRVGAAGIGLPVDDVMTLVEDYALGEQGVISLVAADGTVKLRPGMDTTDEPSIRDLPGFASVADGLLAGDGIRTAEFDADGQAQFVAATDIPSLGWVVLAQQPSAQLTAGVRDALAGVLLAAALVAIAVVGIASLVVRSIRRPVERLRGVASRLAEGDVAVEVPAFRSPELGSLADDMRGLAEYMQEMAGAANRSPAATWWWTCGRVGPTTSSAWRSARWQRGCVTSSPRCAGPPMP